jgi:hypothetical protein
MKLTSFAKFFAAFFTIVLVAAALMSLTGLVAQTALFISVALFFLYQLKTKSKGVLNDGLYPELWTGELLDKFRFDKKWLSLIPRRDDLVKSNTIHLVDIGVDPAVLINNTTYPIPTAGRTDADIALTLDKFDTENTRITEDELYNLPYDKEGSVLNDHRRALEDKTAIKSAHSLAPASGKIDGSTPNTPIVLTSGEADNRANGRKRFTPEDIINAKEALDQLDIPTEGRVLLLDFLHLNDLLKLDQKFKEQWANMQKGTLMTEMFGFTIAQNFRAPVYTVNAGTYTKKAFGAASTPATDLRASLFFYAPRSVQAVGTARMFYRQAELDPENRENTVGFRTYQLCLQKKAQGFGAILAAPTV